MFNSLYFIKSSKKGRSDSWKLSHFQNFVVRIYLDGANNFIICWSDFTLIDLTSSHNMISNKGNILG